MTTLLKAQTRNPKQTTAGRTGMQSLKAVMYGRELPNQTLEVSLNEFMRVYREVKQSMLFDVSVDGKEPVKALIQEVQVNPITMVPIHVDLRQIRMDQPITLSVPLIFTGESGAVKLGGTLVKALDELEVTCLPADLPKEIVVDLAPLATFQDRITVSSLTLPHGVKVEQRPEEVIALVEAPLTEEELKQMEAAEVGDVTAVTTEADEKRKEKEAADASEA